MHYFYIKIFTTLVMSVNLCWSLIFILPYFALPNHNKVESFKLKERRSKWQNVENVEHRKTEETFSTSAGMLTMNFEAYLMEVWELVPCSLYNDGQEARKDEAEEEHKLALGVDNERAVDNASKGVRDKAQAVTSVHRTTDDVSMC